MEQMDEVKKLMEIKENISNLSSKKIRIEERFNNEKEKLEKLLKEIQEKGYDPKKLSELRVEKEGLLKKSLMELEEKIRTITEKITKIEELQNA